MAVTGVGDRSPGTVSGRARGIGIVPAVPTELAASKRAVRQRKLVVMFQRAATVRLAYLKAGVMEHGGPFDISSRSGGNLEPIAVCQENPTFELAPTSKGSASAHDCLVSEKVDIFGPRGDSGGRLNSGVPPKAADFAALR